jgi:hypothetical protein
VLAASDGVELVTKVSVTPVAKKVNQQREKRQGDQYSVVGSDCGTGLRFLHHLETLKNWWIEVQLEGG